MSAYQTLERRFARIAALSDALGILQWDTETLMPPGAADGRAEQLATLKVISHELLTDEDNADLLADAEHQTDLSDWQAANLHEMHRAYLHATAVPTDLVEANSRAVSRCEMVWRDARPAGDFAMLLPSLSEVLNLQRQIAAAKAEALGCSLYESLLDAYEPGGNTDHIDKVFGDLRHAHPVAPQRKMGTVLEHLFPQQPPRQRAIDADMGLSRQAGRGDLPAEQGSVGPVIQQGLDRIAFGTGSRPHPLRQARHAAAILPVMKQQVRRPMNMAFTEHNLPPPTRCVYVLLLGIIMTGSTGQVTTIRVPRDGNALTSVSIHLVQG